MNLENFWKPKKETDLNFREEVMDSYEDSLEPKGADQNEKAYTHEQVPSDLISTSEIFEKHGVTLDEVHGWYSAAISRRDREPLESERFVGHFEGMSLDATFAFGEREKGYLLGYLKYGVFVPTHFAPKTMRGGYELMKRLGESANVPSVMSVTEDLEETLSKMPSWQTLDIGFLASFREELKEKKIVYNSHPDTKNLMLGLVTEYLEEAKKGGDMEN